ncbi:MAG: 1,4-dihydroxy-2-naphthoate polyprenyltransferase, partial [Thermoplasmatota archaeon]
MSAWIQALRPKTLPAAAVPVAVGAAHAWHMSQDNPAYGAFRVPVFAAALAGALLIQVGTNLANDYYDHVKGADRERVGPARASASGAIPPRRVRNAAALAFLAAIAVGGYLWWRSGWPVVVVGLLSVACGVLYTAGPKPLGYMGWGDALVLLFFGPVAVMGTTYVLLPSSFFTAIGLWLPAFFLGLQIGVIATAILVVNNLRDRDGDRRAGKRTLAVRMGVTGSRVEYTALLGFAFLMSALSVGMHGRWGLLLPWVSLPLAW